MTCSHCELTIESALAQTPGIYDVNASFRSGIVQFDYDASIVTLNDIKSFIQQLGYSVSEDPQSTPTSNTQQMISILIILLGGYVILEKLGLLNFTKYFPSITSSMNYGMLFIIGIFTSLHCVAMCGGINLAQSVNSSKDKKSTIRPNLLYNLGRVVSYTWIGGVVGLLGSVIQPSGSFRGTVAIFAGLFMMIMGLNMLNIFPWLRRFHLKMPKFIARRVHREKSKQHSSFYIGLLNGLMPCGPLQSMQLYALSTGSFFGGALSMFLFSVGTVPLMFFLGTISSKLNKRFTNHMMSLCSILIVVLGIGMLRNGLALSGIVMPQIHGSESGSYAMIQGDYQEITTQLDFGSYPTIVVKAGTPVKWIIYAEHGTLNGCNNELIIPEYNIDIKLSEGENTIEFIPTREGQYGYSCWMGMIRGAIIVTDI